MKLIVTQSQKYVIDALHEFDNEGQFSITWNEEHKEYQLNFKYNNDNILQIRFDNFRYKLTNLINNEDLEGVYFNYNDIKLNKHILTDTNDKKKPYKEDDFYVPEKIIVTHEEKRFTDIIFKHFPGFRLWTRKGMKEIRLWVLDVFNNSRSLFINIERTNMDFKNCIRPIGSYRDTSFIEE